MDTNNIVRRSILMVAGLAVMSFGIALSTKGDLGTTPLSSPPYVLSLETGISLGTMTFIFNFFFIIAQIALMRRSTDPLILLQIPLLFIFSALIDASAYILTPFGPSDYFGCWIYTIVSVIIIALGLTMMVFSNIAMMPIDAFVFDLSSVTKIKFSTVKVIFDVLMVTVAAIMSLIFFNMQLIGVREGSIFAGIFTGIFVRCFTKLFKKVAPDQKENVA